MKNREKTQLEMICLLFLCASNATTKLVLPFIIIWIIVLFHTVKMVVYTYKVCVGEKMSFDFE